MYALIAIISISLFFICLGLLCGSALNVKQVGGICGALITNLTGWFAGIWFDISTVGGAFEKIANALPFVHMVNLEKAILNGNCSDVSTDILWIVLYTVASIVISILLFLRQMKKQ